jgi:uncharacterized damage-inducible protein DinB
LRRSSFFLRDVPTLDKLFDHLEWADALILGALRVSPDPRALEIYSHILGSEHVWISRVRGEKPKLAVWPELTVDACASLAAENARELRTFIGQERMVHYTNSAGAQFDSSVEDILLHVATHGQYHRGQVNLLLRQSGASPAPVDYIAWARGVPAATRR